MSRTRIEPTAIVQSLHNAAVRGVNALEKCIVGSEDDADEKLWEQAAQVVALLDGGMTQRALAKQWINARTGEPYSVMHVNYTKQAFVQFTLQPRPRFRDAYNEVANVTSAPVDEGSRIDGDGDAERAAKRIVKTRGPEYANLLIFMLMVELAHCLDEAGALFDSVAATEEVASAMNAPIVCVWAAERVRKQRPDLADRIKAGEITLSQALRQLREATA